MNMIPSICRIPGGATVMCLLMFYSKGLFKVMQKSPSSNFTANLFQGGRKEWCVCYGWGKKDILPL